MGEFGFLVCGVRVCLFVCARSVNCECMCAHAGIVCECECELRGLCARVSPRGMCVRVCTLIVGGCVRDTRVGACMRARVRVRACVNGLRVWVRAGVARV